MARYPFKPVLRTILMRRLLFPAFALLLLLSGCLGPQQYSNLGKGFSTLQPAGWMAYEDEMRVAFVPLGSQDAQITILSASSAENVTLQNLSYSMDVRLVPPQSDVHVVSHSERSLEVSGVPALWQTIRLRQPVNGADRESLMELVYLRSGSRYFILSLMFSPQDQSNWQAQGQFEEAFESVVSNFKLI
jgi:hypothetical protein